MSDLFRLDGKVVAVIGAGSGIGRAVALGAARQGARVACLDINEDAAQAVAQQIRDEGGTADALSLDIVDGGATDQALDRVACEWRTARRAHLHAQHQRAQEAPGLRRR